MAGFFSDILDMFFPPKCTFCGRFLKKREKDICAECLESLPYTREAAFRKDGNFTVCVSPLYYKDNARKAIMRFKFNGKTAYARPFGAMMAQCINEHLKGRYNLITWVPLSRERLKKRGYSQSALLAMATALELDDIAADVLEKHKDVPAQSSLEGKDARRENVKGVYRIKEPQLILGKRILIIDDIITTGETLSECARILLNAGAEEVLCCTLCLAN